MRIKILLGISLLSNLTIALWLLDAHYSRIGDLGIPKAAQRAAPEPPLVAETPNHAPVVDTDELVCLAKTIYFEARGEPYIGQVAVARVVISRVRSGNYPNTICRTVTQGRYRSWRNLTPEEIAAQPAWYPPQPGKPCQFSWYCDGLSDVPTMGLEWTAALRIAYDVIAYDAWNGVFDEVTHFHSAKVKPQWASGLDKVVRISNHLFYKDKERGA